MRIKEENFKELKKMVDENKADSIADAVNKILDDFFAERNCTIACVTPFNDCTTIPDKCVTDDPTKKDMMKNFTNDMLNIISKYNNLGLPINNLEMGMNTNSGMCHSCEQEIKDVQITYNKHKFCSTYCLRNYLKSRNKK